MNYKYNFLINILIDFIYKTNLLFYNNLSLYSFFLNFFELLIFFLL